MAKNEIIKINSEMLNKMQVLGRGACSVVYKYGDNQVIKALNENGVCNFITKNNLRNY